MICYLYSNPIYLLYSSDVPALLYYAQVPATIIALLLGFYIFLIELTQPDGTVRKSKNTVVLGGKL